jgi:hypothetical protein
MLMKTLVVRKFMIIELKKNCKYGVGASLQSLLNRYPAWGIAVIGAYTWTGHDPCAGRGAGRPALLIGGLRDGQKPTWFNENNILYKIYPRIEPPRHIVRRFGTRRGMQGVGMTERGVRQAAALLVSLAALADRSAYRCLAVRWFVLVLLRHAETVVLRVVGNATGWDRSALEVALGIEVPDVAEGRSSSGRGPADALALAMRLRALAALLRAFLPPDDLVGSGGARTAGALVRSAARLRSRPCVWSGRRVPAPDTS